MTEKRIKERMETLKEMNEVICDKIGDEQIWYEWITLGIPDGAVEDDYEYIASDKERYDEIANLFFELVPEEG